MSDLTITGTDDTVSTIVAPEGATFEFEEVKTAKGTQSLGEVPILVYGSHAALVGTYGKEGVLAIADGTSLRVSFQNIARRFKASGKSNGEIAKAQLDFRPGKRAVGQSTPTSRAARKAREASEKSGNPEAVEKLLAKIASGEISAADLEALTT